MPHTESVLPLGVPIAPTEPNDPNPTHIAEYGRGGLMSVADLTARGNISSDRKTAGMLVYVQSEAKYYTLTTLPNTWTELSTGGGEAVTSVTGTANEVTVSPTTGAVVVGLPDDVTVRDLNAEHVKFDTTPTVTTAAQADMVWTDNQSTVSVGMSSTVSAALGQTVYKRGKNTSGAPIAKGKAVYISGGTGSADLTFGLASNATEVASSAAIGFAAETIADNAHGFVICTGLLTGIDTSAFPMNEGQAMYLGTAGGVLSSLPTQPLHGVFCGWLVKKGAGSSGVLYAKFDNYQELEELSDVLIGTAGGGVALASGQVLQYDGTVWRNQASSSNVVITTYEFDETTGSQSVAVGANCKFWIVEGVGGGCAGSAGTTTSGGTGGGAGMYAFAVIPAEDLGSTVSVTIGAGSETVSQAGSTILRNTTTNTIVFNAMGNPGGSSTYQYPGTNTTNGFGAGGSASSPNGRVGGYGSGGGGSGGNTTSLDGGDGGAARTVAGSTSGASVGGGGTRGAGTVGGNGTSGSIHASGFGSGAGGGGGNTTGNGGNGGNGIRGSGGGGGGRGASSFFGGSGGIGGSGFVRIIEVRSA